MSWNIEVTGASKTETLAAFNEAVDKDAHCEPKEGVKEAARLLSEPMAEGFVSKARTSGHANENGKHCSAAVFINC